MNKRDEDNTHGGKREGAGRPSKGRSKKTVYVTDYEFEKIKELIEELRNK